MHFFVIATLKPGINKEYEMALEALVFDVDGTLSETERDGHLVAFNRAFKEAGLDWFWDEALYGELLTVTGGKERIGFYLDKYNTEFKRPGLRKPP